MSQDRTDDRDAALPEDDAALLAAVSALLEAADPVPPGLADRVRFAIELDDVDAELSRLVELSSLVAARSDEFTRLVTFQGDSLTIMITLERGADGTTRIDGWLTPAACRQVEVRCPARQLSTESDDTGRFSLDGVPSGTVRLVVHDPGSTHRVITPTIEL
ncbi:hypothetical protein [Actinophytocola glycyrrhizae]|uniref:Carboxypeptidase regulatory-like domain-containing protein n=1 Tax=Actinophytocola glycyrrhizae TaxID=2044873 RepID=A0ABV9RUF6_9PSEU